MGFMPFRADVGLDYPDGTWTGDKGEIGGDVY
jgi:hypothetical protein